MEPGERPPLKVDLRYYSTREGLPGGDEKGRSAPVRALWILCNSLILRNPLLPFYSLRVSLLRAFGASIGRHVLIKPGVNVSRPWNLTIGDHCWVGEGAWLDSTAPLRIGSHVVISQGAFLSCGMHDWQDPGMGSVIAPITVEDGAWIASFARVAGNVTVGQEAVVALGSVVFTDCEVRGTYRGNPAQKVGSRRIRNEPGPARSMAAMKRSPEGQAAGVSVGEEGT